MTFLAMPGKAAESPHVQWLSRIDPEWKSSSAPSVTQQGCYGFCSVSGRCPSALLTARQWAVERPDLEPGEPHLEPALGKSYISQERQAFDVPAPLDPRIPTQEMPVNLISLASFVLAFQGSVGVKGPVASTAGSLRACN